MRVILLQDIHGTGKRGDTKNVSEGFFRNFLRPNRLAVLPTEELAKKFVQEKQRVQEQEKKHQHDLENAFMKINNTNLTFEERASSDGTLFRGIKKEIVAERLKGVHGLSIDPQYIQLAAPLKQVGEYPIVIESPKGFRATVTCVIQKRKT